jgi:N utilization substance protein B
VSRRKGRILAFQALYAWEVGKVEPEELYSFSWAEPESLEKTGESGLAFARLLIAGTIEHMAEIDVIIKNHLLNWDFDRLSKVDLSLLRISIDPLLDQKDIHPTVVIDEAVGIAKIYSGDDSYKFINAILDAIRKELCGV